MHCDAFRGEQSNRDVFSENKFPSSVFENHNVSLLFNEKRRDCAAV